MSDDNRRDILDFEREKIVKQVREVVGAELEDDEIEKGLDDAQARAELYKMYDLKMQKELWEVYGIEPRRCCNIVCSNNQDSYCYDEDMMPVSCLYRMTDPPPNEIGYDGYVPTYREALEMLEHHDLLYGEKHRYIEAMKDYGKAKGQEGRWATEISGIDFNILQECITKVLQGDIYAESDPLNEVSIDVHATNICLEVEKAMGIYPNIVRLY